MMQSDPRQRVLELTPLIENHADQAERDRHLPGEVASALAHAGLFRVAAPRAIGGEEWDPKTQIEVIELVSEIDGATGWNLMIGIEVMGLLGAALQADVAKDLYSDPGLIAAGALNPKGQARPVEGGYRVSGQWPFASGCHNAQWFWGQCILFDGDGDGDVAKDEAGRTRLVEVLVPAEDYNIIDTWQVSGMRGSGSHDVAVSDVFVPEHHVTWATVGGPIGMQFVDESPLFRFPAFARLAYNKVGVSMGIANAALKYFSSLATEKQPRASTSLLAGKVSTQLAYAEAMSTHRAARAYVMEAIDDIWATILAGDETTAEQRMHVHLSCSSAAESAVKTVELLHTAAGSTANFADCPLDRQLRNARVVPQHIMVSHQWKETAGRVFLGLPGDAVWFND